MKNEEGRKFSILHSAFCVLNSFVLTVAAACAFANDLSIDRRSIRAGESLTITVSLEDDFTALDEVHVPVRNLTLDPRPSVESAFTWINATMMRRKVFRFRARAQTAGIATIGPLTLIAPNGRRETLQPLSLQVLPDRAAGSNEPAVVLRELLASGRDQFFVVAEVDKTSAFVGEQIVVTWWLYNAASVQQWQIGAIPKLDNFWLEELDVRSAQPYQVFVGDYAMQKVPIRRVALFPLRSGTLDIGSIEVEAAIMHRVNTDPLWRYEGNLVEISFASAPLKVDVKPLPPAGAGVSAIGEFSLRCSDPLQKNGGPVTMDAVLSGRGNVRAASAPRFASAPAGDVQMVEGGVNVEKGRSPPGMVRRWKYIIFPSTSGTLRIPQLEMPIFAPSTATREVLRCEATRLAVDAAQSERTASVKGGSGSARRISWQQGAAGAALALAAVAVVIPLRRRFAVRREVRRLIGGRSPAEIRDAVHIRLEERGVDPAVLMRESSDRGEAYRSLRSLLDALERDRIEVRDPRKEVRRRLRDLLVA